MKSLRQTILLRFSYCFSLSICFHQLFDAISQSTPPKIASEIVDRELKNWGGAAVLALRM